MSTMKMPGFTAEASLYKISGHCQPGRQALNLPAQTNSSIYPATMKGEDKTGKNCEREEKNGSSTFGKCESVCKGKELTRDALNNRWVCKASAIGRNPLGWLPVGGGGSVLLSR